MGAGDYQKGLNGVFNWGASGAQAATPTDIVRNVTLNMSKRTAEAVRRGKTWVAKVPVITEATLEFEVYDIEGDAFLAALKTAFLTDARIALYPTDVAGGDGLDGDFYITSFGRNEANEEFTTFSVTAEPTDEERDPQWV